TGPVRYDDIAKLIFLIIIKDIHPVNIVWHNSQGLLNHLWIFYDVILVQPDYPIIILGNLSEAVFPGLYKIVFPPIFINLGREPLCHSPNTRVYLFTFWRVELNKNTVHIAVDRPETLL